ncbi:MULTISPECIES: hypothetical protein [Brevibacillus]|uniref:hypothetical protein n=1 Tax=Brevibacillus TaxID=55080 RepID=UPI00257A781E|nr:hypothetical protein [Brevibacillus sp.]
MEKVRAVEAIMAHFGCEEGDIHLNDDSTFELNDSLQEYKLIELPIEDQKEYQYAVHKI